MASKAQNFVPIQIGAGSGGGTADGSACISSAQARPLEITAPLVCGVIEIEVNGPRIRVEPGVEMVTLATVLSALREIR